MRSAALQPPATSGCIAGPDPPLCQALCIFLTCLLLKHAQGMLLLVAKFLNLVTGQQLCNRPPLQSAWKVRLTSLCQAPCVFLTCPLLKYAQGMLLLVAKFLNLVTGQHVNSRKFWVGEVTVGVVQRYGAIAITDDERSHLLAVCSEPQVSSHGAFWCLQFIVPMLHVSLNSLSAVPNAKSRTPKAS